MLPGAATSFPLLALLALAQAPGGPAPGSASSDPPSRELLRELCASARLAGTTGSLVGARTVARRLEAAGWQVELDPREVLLCYPRRTELEVYAGPGGGALHARVESFDPDAIPPGDVPPYNAWSASGDVRGPVVDAGRGLSADFARLLAAGVDLRGAIALVRYGGSYRGIKVDLAERHGCAAVLLWSEPKSDGTARGPTWPQGPWKHGHEAQRGSISPMARTPGDPSTPGWASPRPGEAARRLSTAELDAALPRIPCLPIGAAEAEILLAGLAPRAFVDAQGAVSEEAIGPGPREARLRVDSPRELRTIWNVLATLPGASADYVLAGAHRDAWVRGANDDGSGCVVLMRAAQELGARARGGWKPAHTLKLAFWDAEEFGLIGSTEWGEANVEEIAARCIVYVNSDVAVSGTRFSGAGGTPGMLGALERVLRRVEGVDGAPLWSAWERSLPAGGRVRLGLPGSGSDFAVFVHHLGLPFVEVGLGGNGGGQYHTDFDDVAIVERHLDPGYVGHELCARLHVELLAELSERGRAAFDGAEAAQRLAEEALELAAGAGLDVALADSARALSAELRAAADALAANPAAGRRFYADLADPEGLPGRAWYRNVLWTPGLLDGYGSETYPTLRAAAEDPARARAAAEAIRARVARLRAAALDR